jgi:hypothetical protein
MGIDYTPSLMTRLSEFFEGKVEDGVDYGRGPKYVPHLYWTKNGDLARQTLRAWLQRGWVMDVRSNEDDGPLGTIYLTDDGRQIVEAFAT